MRPCRISTSTCCSISRGGDTRTLRRARSGQKVSDCNLIRTRNLELGSQGLHCRPHGSYLRSSRQVGTSNHGGFQWARHASDLLSSKGLAAKIQDDGPSAPTDVRRLLNLRMRGFRDATTRLKIHRDLCGRPVTQPPSCKWCYGHHPRTTV
jgi:hypothetical protein